MAKIITIVNQKGGVAKTTTTKNLGYGLVKKGLRVLLIDLDSQYNLGTGLGLDIDGSTKTIFSRFKGDASTKETIQHAHGLDIIPSNMVLKEFEHFNNPAKQVMLWKVLQEVGDEYDFILIDCPPSLADATINGITAADYCIVPVDPELYSVEGIAQINTIVSELSDIRKSPLRGLLFVIIKKDERISVKKEYEGQLREHLKNSIFKTCIRTDAKILESDSQQKPIQLFAPKSKAAQDYDALASEVQEVCI